MSAQADFTANLLGAFADQVSELLDDAVRVATGHRGETAAALVTLRQEPGLSVRRLTDILGIRPPSGVQLVTRLAGQGLVDRQAGPDRRTRSLVLTTRGVVAADAVLAARSTVLHHLLDQVPDDERAALHDTLGRLLGSLTTSRGVGDHICRRCDEPACPGPDCPVEEALRLAPTSSGRHASQAVR